jgi:hypothetical protein
MAPTETCEHCHFATLREHPEDKFRQEGYLKCPLCGFTKQIKSEIKDHERIVNGSPKRK